MQKCLECGKVFEDDEIAHWQESRGEFWGFPAYETMSGCPHCQGDYEEAKECANCGEIFALSDLDFDGLCENCRKDEENEENTE
jgi:predicted  nucleic acid-binding Zn-ribbon protein